MEGGETLFVVVVGGMVEFVSVGGADGGDVLTGVC